MQFGPEQNTGYRGNHGQNRTDQPDRLRTDGIEVNDLLFNINHTFRTVGIAVDAAVIITFCPLRQNFSTALFGAFKGDTAALDQHPAGDNVVDHQQHKPDGDRGFQAAEQCL